MRGVLVAVAILAVVGTAYSVSRAPVPAPADRYDAAATTQWRAEREQKLRSGSGWLTVAGLTFIGEGVSSIGSAADNDVVLPPPAPARAGHVSRSAERVSFTPADGAGLVLDGKPVDATVPLTTRDRLAFGPVSFQLHRSGERLGIRVRDANSELRRGFGGLRWFDVQDAWAIDARFVAFDEPRAITVPNVLGDTERLTLPGEVVFDWQGETIRLQAAEAGDRLWIIFSDGLAGRKTYRIRFLSADAPDASGRVLLDFNRAYNPPCAYNPFTTCPLPPAQNRLRLSIDAGEMIPPRPSSSHSRHIAGADWTHDIS